MATSDPYQYGEETPEHGGVGAPRAGGLPPGAYKFSEEELRTLKECNAESFYQRSLPLSTLFGLATYSGVQRGALRPSPRFGAYPKVSLAVVAGYFLGKLSYQRACADKLMALPNSYIGQLLRERRDPALATRRVQPAPPMLGARPDEIYSDAGPGSSLDLDVERPLFGDEPYRPTDDDGGGGGGGGGGAAADMRAAPSATYEELRRRNRAVRQDPYRVEPAPAPRARATNRYGDAVD